MPTGRRLLLALLGLVPLIAPYELLVAPSWSDWRHPAFLFAATVSIGALFVSGLLLFAAVAGLDERVRVDASRSLLTYSAQAPLVGLRTVVLPFASIERIEVVTREWGEGPDSYAIRVVPTDGRSLETGSDNSLELVESYADQVRAATGRGAAP